MIVKFTLDMLQLFAEGRTNFIHIKNDGLKKIHSDSSRLLVP
jgi:hypothetical protein